MSAFLSTVSMASIATAIKNLFATSKVRLSKSNVNYNVNSVIGDFDEADFGGYAALSMANAVLIRDDATGDYVVSPGIVCAFTANSTITAPQTVYAAYVTNTAGTSLIAFSTVDPAYTFVNDGDGLIVNGLVFRLPMNVAQT